MKICKKCGTENHPDEIFCTNCGENLMRKEYLVSENNEEKKAETPEKELEAVEENNSESENNEAVEEDSPKRKRSKKPLIISLIIVAVLLLIVGGVLSYFYFFWTPEQPDKNMIIRDLKSLESISRVKVGGNEYEFDITDAELSGSKVTNKEFTCKADITRECEVYGISPEKYTVTYVKSGTSFKFSKAAPENDTVEFYAVKGVEEEIAAKKVATFYKDAKLKEQKTDMEKGVDRLYYTIDTAEYEGTVAIRYDFSKTEGWVYNKFSDKNLEVKKGITHKDKNGLLTNSNIKNILFLGVDSDSGVGRSDCMMLISVDSNTGKIKQTSFMRDNWFEIPGHGQNKLNAAYAFGGAKLTIKTIENTFGIKIDNYVSVSFTTFKDVINALDGVNVNITSDEAGYINWQLQKNGQTSVGLVSTAGGVTRLNGQQALWLCRDRGGNGFGGDDFTRSARQRRVIRSLVSDYKNYTPAKVLKTLKALNKSVKTDLTGEDFKWYAQRCTRFFSFKFKERGVPQAGEWQSGTSAGGAWIIQLNDFKKLKSDVQHYIYEDLK